MEKERKRKYYITREHTPEDKMGRPGRWWLHCRNHRIDAGPILARRSARKLLENPPSWCGECLARERKRSGASLELEGFDPLCRMDYNITMIPEQNVYFKSLVSDQLKKRGMSKTRLARLSNVSDANLGRWLNGRRLCVTDRTLHRILSALGGEVVFVKSK